MSRLEIWAATPAPFDAEGRLDTSVIAEQARHLTSVGVRGAFVNGTTGEFPALSPDERRRTAEAWAQARAAGFGLAVHVGSTDPAEATGLAMHAESLGVDFIAAVAPYYGGAPTVDLVVGYLKMVSSAAPRTPLCYYHIPSMTGAGHQPSEIVARAATEVPTLTSVKFTDSDLMEFDRTRAAAGGIKVYFGKDELLPAALSFGADAVIGSLYNGLGQIAHSVTEAFDAGDHTRAFELHRPFREIASASDQHGGLGMVKEMLNALGPDCGRPRTPWGPLDAGDRAAADSLAASVRQVLSDQGPVERASA